VFSWRLVDISVLCIGSSVSPPRPLRSTFGPSSVSFAVKFLTSFVSFVSFVVKLYIFFKTQSTFAPDIFTRTDFLSGS
jgi:hypothetical protein